LMPAKKRSHSELVAASDPPDQHFVGASIGRRRPCRRMGGPS
jgi:hypothetical protein